MGVIPAAIVETKSLGKDDPLFPRKRPTGDPKGDGISIGSLRGEACIRIDSSDPMLGALNRGSVTVGDSVVLKDEPTLGLEMVNKIRIPIDILETNGLNYKI